MPLIKCRECGNDISDRSLFCPRCGHPTHLSAGTAEPPEFTVMRRAVEPASTAEEPDPDTALEARRRRRNERAKVALFLLAFLGALAVVLYFYFTSPVNAGGEDAEMEEEIEAIAADPDSVEQPAMQPAAPAPARAASPAATSKAGPAAETAERVITVAPLSQQAAPPRSNDATPDQSPEP